MADHTRKMLTEIRKRIAEANKVELPKTDAEIKKNLISEQTLIVENQNKAMVINEKDVQFGSVRSSQIDIIRKTVGDVTFKPDALKYYPQSTDGANIISADLVINGEISGLGVTFQFRYKDRSGDGCYVWAEGLQLTEANLRTVEKIRDAFQNWKQSLVNDGDLFQKLEKEATKQ